MDRSIIGGNPAAEKMRSTGRTRHNPDEVQTVLVGLALVASMPIAGSSTAWAQNADGDLALSLGLVLLSTLISPLTTPLAMHAVGHLAAGDYAEDLHELAAGGVTGFLAIGVLLPMAAGVAGRMALGEARLTIAKPGLKLVNLAVLLVLNYANAASALPRAVARPDWDFLGVTLAVVVVMCGTSFAAGWAVARAVRADGPRRASLVFGLGMSNNGTGLVLATTALADHPLVLLPIIIYNLVQHVAAAVADRLLSRVPLTGDGSAPRVNKRLLGAVLFGATFGLLASTAGAQEPAGQAKASPKSPAPGKEDLSPAPAKVDVQPVARDAEIRKRLQSVLEATGWFVEPKVRVEEGVVFLSGRTETDDLKKWAGDLARNTQDVVAVANRMEVSRPSVWDFSAAWGGLSGLWRDFVRSIPLFVFGLLILGLSALAGWVTTLGVRSLLRRRVRAKLLRGVLAFGAGFFVFLVGTYVVLRVSGLTQLALTVVGGTGLVGLAVGIAFRDITENFLASIFLSMQRPFGTGDLIEAAGVTGFVQQLNVRTTVLMSLDGNLVQIPNATVYKSTLRNFTANPNRREDLVVGIGYDDPIDKAQEVARQVLADHPAVLNKPEPWVLADGFGSATVNLRIYFWLDGREHSWLKVRSSVIRLVKRAYQQHGISMPDEAREVVFPKGVPVTLLDGKPGLAAATKPPERTAHRPSTEDSAVSTKAEAGLSSEASVIEEQARQSKPLDAGENLLKGTAGVRPPA